MSPQFKKQKEKKGIFYIQYYENFTFSAVRTFSPVLHIYHVGCKWQTIEKDIDIPDLKVSGTTTLDRK